MTILIKSLLWCSLLCIFGSCSQTVKLTIPNTPAAEEIPFEAQVFPEAYNEIDYDKTHKHYKLNIPTGSKVVISVPADINRGKLTSSNESDFFRTVGYYNLAEQFIEQALIRNKFTIVDRSKLEQVLRKKLGHEKSSQRRISTLFGLYGGNKLLSDADVIEAAEDPSVNADFILQINEFTKPDSSEAEFYPSNLRTKFSYFLDTIPRGGIHNDPGIVSMPGPILFNANLMEVKSGNILWQYTYEVNSLGLLLESDDLNAHLYAVRYPVNAVEVEAYINYMNTKKMSRVRKGKKGDRIIKEREDNIPKWKYEYLVYHSFDRNIEDIIMNENLEEKNDAKLNDQLFMRMLRKVTHDLINTITKKN